MAIPNVKRFRDPNGEVGLVPKKTNDTDGSKVKYDTSSDLWKSEKGFQVERYNSSTGSYDKKVTITDEIEVLESGKGIILTSPDGSQRKRVFLDNSGSVQTENV